MTDHYDSPPTFGDPPVPNGASQPLIGLVKGDRVRLKPSARGDILDLALAGQTAVVDAIEEDFEGKRYVAVVVDGDPGISMGRRRPGHRFFFAPDEVERVDGGNGIDVDAHGARILVAGIGNIFMGDDAFGVEVAQRLAQRDQPDRVTITDYGIRSYDLAYALMSNYEHVVLIDACSRGDGGPPGTLYVIEADLASVASDDTQPVTIDAHMMNPVHLLSLARSMGAKLDHVLIVGCEPASFGPMEGQMGMSDVVTAAVDHAVPLVESLIARLLLPPSQNQVQETSAIVST